MWHARCVIAPGACHKGQALHHDHVQSGAGEGCGGEGGGGVAGARVILHCVDQRRLPCVLSPNNPQISLNADLQMLQ